MLNRTFIDLLSPGYADKFLLPHSCSLTITKKRRRLSGCLPFLINLFLLLKILYFLLIDLEFGHHFNLQVNFP